jgi:hypothetical protein
MVVSQSKPWNSLSVYSPIFTSAGIQDGILEIAFRVDAVLAQERVILMVMVGLFIGIVGIAAFAGWQLGTLYKGRIDSLVQGIREIIEGNPDFIFNQTGPDELTDLSLQECDGANYKAELAFVRTT